MVDTSTARTLVWKHDEREPAAHLTRKQIRRLLRLARSPLASRVLVGALITVRPNSAAA